MASGKIKKLNGVEKIATAVDRGITYTVTKLPSGVKEMRFDGFLTEDVNANATISLTWTFESGKSRSDIHIANDLLNFYKSMNISDFSNEIISFYFGGAIYAYSHNAWPKGTLIRGQFTFI